MRLVIPSVVVVALSRINEVLFAMRHPEMRFIIPRRVNLRETKGEENTPLALSGPENRSISSSTFRVDICGPGMVARVDILRNKSWTGVGRKRRLAGVEDVVTSIRLRVGEQELVLEGAGQIVEVIFGRWVPALRPRAVASQS